jgi:hypothetical protein
MSWCRAHSGTCDQILLPVGTLLSESCSLVSMGAPSLTRWRVCSLQCNQSMVRVAEPVTILYCLIWDFPNLEDQVHVFISPGTGWPSYTPGTGFPLRRLLRLTGLRWWYSNPPPHRKLKLSQAKSSYITTGSHSASLSWCRIPISDPRPFFPSILR